MNYFLAFVNHEDYTQYLKLKSIDFWFNFKILKGQSIQNSKKVEKYQKISYIYVKDIRKCFKNQGNLWVKTETWSFLVLKFKK